MTIVITTCTSRKRKPARSNLHALSLPAADLTTVAGEWCARIRAADARYPAADLYGGRGFKEANTVAERLGVPLLIVSAGLGLVSSDTAVPSYACTVIAGAPDSVLSRLSDGSSASDWWRTISAALPTSSQVKAAFEASGGLVLAALSEAYINLIAAELEALPAAARRRLRIFTRAPLHRISDSLKPLVMPYDDRLNGPDSPVRGTQSDFAGRALRHFADHILAEADARDAAEHAAAVIAAIANWSLPERHDRVRHDDPTLRTLIAEHWEFMGGSSSKLLPFFRRELNIACEQGRFAALVREVRSAQA